MVRTDRRRRVRPTPDRRRPDRPPFLHNGDISWDRFDTDGYLADNYATMHAFDEGIIRALAPYYRSLAPRSLTRSLDVGTGPNLYPLMLAAAASRRLEALDHSAANVAHLCSVVQGGAAPSWQPFWALCRELVPDLPTDLDQVLRGVQVRQGAVQELPPASYDLVSMFFVAESVTGDREEFATLCAGFAAAAAPGGHLVAAFMAGMPSYRLGGRTWPSVPVDEADVARVLGPLIRDLRVWRLPPDPTLPYEHDGVLLATARQGEED